MRSLHGGISYATRQVRWAKQAASRLREQLGGRCACCGTSETLTFDCISPQGDKHHRAGRVSRICFYRKQWRQGNIQLLCSRCNELKGGMERADWDMFRRYQSACLHGKQPVDTVEQSRLQQWIRFRDATIPY